MLLFSQVSLNLRGSFTYQPLEVILTGCGVAGLMVV